MNFKRSSVKSVEALYGKKKAGEGGSASPKTMLTKYGSAA
jgi:hypothetical protein